MIDSMAWRRLSSLVLLTDPFGLAPVHDTHIWVVCIHTPVAQVHKGFSGLDSAVLYQDGDLLQLGL